MRQLSWCIGCTPENCCGCDEGQWTPPWRPGLRQAICKGPNCTQVEGVGTLVVAMTLDDNGYCTSCARTVDQSHRELRLDFET